MKPIKLQHIINAEIDTPIRGLDSITTKAIMAQHQKIIQSDKTLKQNSLKQGGTYVKGGKVIATIGIYGLTPAQLTQVRGGLKPGMDKQVERALKRGLSLSQACPDHFWKSGNLQTFLDNPDKQKQAYNEIIAIAAATVKSVTSNNSSIEKPKGSSQERTKNIQSAPAILGFVATGLAAISVLDKLGDNGLAYLKNIDSMLNAKLDSLMSIAQNGINLASLGLPDISGEIFAALNRIPFNLIASLTNPMELTRLAQLSLTEAAKRALPAGSIDLISDIIDNPSKFMPTPENLEALASNKIAELEGNITGRADEIMGKFSAIENKATAIASQAASLFTNPPDIQLPGLNKLVQQSTSILSQAGDYRIPPLKS